MRYKTGYCFTARDLFDNFNLKALNIPTKLYYGVYKAQTLTEFCASIFTYCMYLIILDIIKNNVTFVLPLVSNREACIYVKPFTGDQFKKLYSGGKFIGIDFLSSNFTGYQIYFQYSYRGGVRDKPIYINSKLKKIFYDNINNGKVYY